MYRNINILKAGGVELRGMKASLAPRRQQAQAPPKLEQYTFIPYDDTTQSKVGSCHINPYPTAFPYGNGMVLHFYQQQESSTTKTVHEVINKGLKTYV